ncbi:MAG: glycosyltransferase family 4 protein [Proteobacteria bacterium]|nr:glycosyltransferase family 4 protein [Pseudomonadota bacterium]
MNVLMVSTSFPRDSGDWRGIFILHMASALSRVQGVALKLWAPPGELPEGIESVVLPGESGWLDRLMEHGGISHGMRERPLRGAAAALRLLRMIGRAVRRVPGIGLYHINWLQCILPLPHDGKPILVSVLGNDMKLLRLPLMKLALRHAMRGRAVAICPNADWMEQPLRDSFGELAEVIPVPFGIDPIWYAITRDPVTPSQWLAVTRLTADKLGPLFEWSAPLFAEGTRELHLFGPMQEQVNVPRWVHYHGAATPERLATEWFPRAQGLITLSRHAEGRPQVMLEAMAAGLPIIASRMPAHADIVQDGVTGNLCASPADYAQAIATIEGRDANLRMGAAAREWIARELGTWDDCAARYVRIYRRLLGQPDHG